MLSTITKMHNNWKKPCKTKIQNLQTFTKKPYERALCLPLIKYFKVLIFKHRIFIFTWSHFLKLLVSSSWYKWVSLIFFLHTISLSVICCGLPHRLSIVKMQVRSLSVWSSWGQGISRTPPPPPTVTPLFTTRWLYKITFYSWQKLK